MIVLEKPLQKSAKHHTVVSHASSSFQEKKDATKTVELISMEEDLDKSLQDSNNKIMTSFLEYQRKRRIF